GPANSRPPQGALLAAALDYHRRGWCLIPTDGQVACVEWKPFQRQPPPEGLLHDWFSGRLGYVTGLAVVLGSASGGWVARDSDPQAGYHAWAGARPRLARRLPTTATKRGYHVYCRGAERFVNYGRGDGEYRGTAKQYTVLPPSPHPKGAVYHW